MTPLATDAHRTARDAVLRIGTVVSVQERTVRVQVDRLKNGAHLLFAGTLIANTSVGGYVKVGKGFSWLIGKVEGEEVVEDRALLGAPRTSVEPALKRVLRLSLVGYIEPGQRFRRGVKELPLVYNECFLLTADEFSQIHQFVTEPDEPIALGTLSFEPGQEIQVGANALFASHFGIFGNTGSGKSYTLAKLYTELFKEYGELPGFRALSRILLIDFNGEYIDHENKDGDHPRGTEVITGDRSLKTEYRLSTAREGGDRFPLSESIARDDQLWSVVLEATEKTQAPFVRRALTNRYWNETFTTEGRFKASLVDLLRRGLSLNDSGVERTFAGSLLREIQAVFNRFPDPKLPGIITRFEQNFHWHGKNGGFYWKAGTGKIIYPNEDDWPPLFESLERTLTLPVTKLSVIERVRLLVVLKYYDESALGFANREHIAPLIKRLERRVNDLDKVFSVAPEGDADATSKLSRPLQVISLRDVNLTMRKIIPMLLAKMFYDANKKAGSEGLLNIVIDEAHNILSHESARETEQWRDYRLETFEEIIKEGRKFRTFLTIASQRPSDISPTILSQLHNYFLHRLINERDIQAIERTVSYLDRVSYEAIPILPTGSCVLAGILAQIPVVVDVGTVPLQNAPNNQTITLVDRWRVEAVDRSQPTLLAEGPFDPDGLPLD